MRRKVWFGIVTTALTVLYFGDLAMAQEVKTRSMFDEFIIGGGLIGGLLILMDVASWAIIIEHFISIRKANILPDIQREQITAMFEQKQYREVIEFTGAQPSFLAYVVHASLGEATHGYAAMERAMEEAIEERTTKLLRKIEILNVFGNIGPMLGLLGTVYGMILCFNAIVAAGGVPEPAMLADSIGVALVTTFWGLVVAIPALTVYAWMRNRIDGLSAEVAMTAQELISTFRPGAERKDRPASSPTAAAVPPVPSAKG